MTNLNQMKAHSLAIRSEIARAKNSFRKDEYERSFEFITGALKLKSSSLIFGQMKFEIDLAFHDYFDELKKSPKFQEFLAKLKIKAANFFIYKQGNEKLLASRLEIISNRLTELKRQAAEIAELESLGRKQRLIYEGEKSLSQGQTPKAKVFFKRAVEEFSNDVELVCKVGEILLKAELLTDASDVLAPFRVLFPAEPRIYKLLIDSYLAQMENEKAEEIYLAAIKQFGGHPRTYLNVSRFYLNWRKKEEAFEFAQKALALDPNLLDAKEICEKMA